MHNLSFTVQVFKEGDMFIAYVPELDLSSCGDTAAKAQTNIQDAVRGFLDVAEEKGTLNEVLEEAGYEHVGNDWKAPELISQERLTMSL